MIRSYAIGDIHGHLADLKAAHARIAADRAATGDTEAPVIHLGDMVDRGPDSRGVIQHLIDGRQRGMPWLVLKGNHDRYFQRYLRAAALSEQRVPDIGWFDPRLGGAATLASYGIDLRGRPERVHRQTLEKVPEAHRAFLEGLPLTHLRGEVLFVHAGIRPGVALADQDEEDLVWIRQPFLDDPRDHGVLVVHGHTALERATHHRNRVNLDSSMAFGGHLTAAVFEGRNASILTDRGRVPLVP